MFHIELTTFRIQSKTARFMYFKIFRQPLNVHCTIRCRLHEIQRKQDNQRSPNNVSDKQSDVQGH